MIALSRNGFIEIDALPGDRHCTVIEGHTRATPVVENFTAEPDMASYECFSVHYTLREFAFYIHGPTIDTLPPPPMVSSIFIHPAVGLHGPTIERIMARLFPCECGCLGESDD